MTEEQAKQAEVQAAAPEAVTGAGLLDDIVQATRLKPEDEYYSVTKAGLQAFLEEMVKPDKEAMRVSGQAVDQIIAEIDKKLSAQVDTILHNEKFQ